MPLRIGTGTHRPILRNSSGLVYGSTYAMRFYLTYNRFPLELYSSSIAQLTLTFYSNINVKVDWGDGNIQSYATSLQGGAYSFLLYAKGGSNGTTVQGWWTNYHSYTDGLTTKKRVITFYFDLLQLRNVSVTNMVLDLQSFDFDFKAAPNLLSFSAVFLNTTSSPGDVNTNASFTTINAAAIASSSMTGVTLQSCFSSNFQYNSVIPSFLFNMPLQTLGIGGRHDLKTFSQSGFDQIYRLGPTLKSLSLSVPFSDAQGLPTTFNQLTNLTSFSYSSVQTWASVPAPIRQLSSVQSIGCYSNYNQTSIGDISAMTGLITLAFTETYNITTSLPVGMVNCTLLKNYKFPSCYGTTARVDAFISNFYSFVTTNAPMTGTSANQFRAMTVDVGTTSGFQAAAVPTGIYRQPTGFVLGISNGSPASSLEMVWVLVNQYAHTWSYRVS